MCSLLSLINSLIDLYIWALIISVVLSLLVNFNVVNYQNQFVNMVGTVLHRLTEPALRPIRELIHRIFGDLGGIDISPIPLILLLNFAQNLLLESFGRGCVSF
ncbi:MAG: YggT family protein [Geminicoccaceae bacterium]